MLEEVLHLHVIEPDVAVLEEVWEEVVAFFGDVQDVADTINVKQNKNWYKTMKEDDKIMIKKKYIYIPLK